MLEHERQQSVGEQDISSADRPRLFNSVEQSGVISTALGGLIAIAAALGFGRFVYTPILPVMIEALGLRRSEAGRGARRRID